jgi:regulator of replication initiation timing
MESTIRIEAEELLQILAESTRLSQQVDELQARMTQMVTERRDMAAEHRDVRELFEMFLPAWEHCEENEEAANFAGELVEAIRKRLGLT